MIAMACWRCALPLTPETGRLTMDDCGEPAIECVEDWPCRNRETGRWTAGIEPTVPAPDTGPTRGDGVVVSSVPVGGVKTQPTTTNPCGAPTSGAGTLSEGAPHA